jgi:hypothetical protein
MLGNEIRVSVDPQLTRYLAQLFNVTLTHGAADKCRDRARCYVSMA